MPQHSVEIIRHPQSVELVVTAQKGHEMAMQLVQRVYEQIDEKTPEGKEWVEFLQKCQNALSAGFEADVKLAHIADVEHTTIIEVNGKLAGLFERVDNLERENKHKVSSVAKHAYHDGRSDEAARRVGYGRGMGR